MTFALEDLEIVRSKRKTLALEVKPGGRIIVRAPLFVTNSEIMRFVNSHKRWITHHILLIEAAEEKAKNTADIKPLTDEEIRELAKKARDYIPKRVEYYAQILGVRYGRITIRNQKTRWGSCSSRGNLNFNCLLMLTPEEVIDSVVVHELCHRLEMNHSRRFYEHVLKAFPDYKKWDKWLKTNGNAIMRRMTN